MTRLPRPLIPLTIPLLLGACALLAPSATGHEPASHARAAARPTAHAASRYQVGVGDEYPEMFGNQLWQQLHAKIARYIAPYDAVAHRDSLARATAWIRAGEEQHVQMLVAFYLFELVLLDFERHVGTGEPILLQPEIMQLRRARMHDRPAHDAGDEEFRAKHDEVLQRVPVQLGSPQSDKDKKTMRDSYEQHLVRLG